MIDNTTRGPKLSYEGLRQHFLNQGLADIARPILLFNENTLGIHAHSVSAKLLALTNESAESIQRATATPDDIKIMSLSLEQCAQFNAGFPILIYAAAFDEREKRDSGGQTHTEQQSHINSALATTVYSAVETIRHLRPKLVRKSKHSSLPRDAIRAEVFSTLTEAWPQDDCHKDPASRCTRISTLWRDGGRRENWTLFFPVKSLPAHIKRRVTRFDQATIPELEDEIQFQKSLVWALLYCESRADVAIQTISEISDRAADGFEENEGQRSSLAATTPNQHRKVVDVLPAAFSGDINPSDLFPNLKIDREHFETMRVLGRLYRELETTVTPGDIKRLKVALGFFELWTAEPWLEKSDDEKERAFWVRSMKAIMPLKRWKDFIAWAVREAETGRKIIVCGPKD